MYKFDPCSSSFEVQNVLAHRSLVLPTPFVFSFVLCCLDLSSDKALAPSVRDPGSTTDHGVEQGHNYTPTRRAKSLLDT